MEALLAQHKLPSQGTSPADCAQAVEEQCSRDTDSECVFPRFRPTGATGRIRVRYNTADVRTDLAFYDSGQADSVQSRFIVGPQELEYLFPVCGEGFVDEPLECPDVVETRRSSAVPFAVLLFPLTLLGAGLRRRTT